MIVCSRISMQSLSMMLNTWPGLTTIVRLITQPEAFRQPKGKLWDIRLESLQRASYLRSQQWQIVWRCCLAGAVGHISELDNWQGSANAYPNGTPVSVKGFLQAACDGLVTFMSALFWWSMANLKNVVIVAIRTLKSLLASLLILFSFDAKHWL